MATATTREADPRGWEAVSDDRLTPAEAARARLAVEESAAAKPPGMTAAEIVAAVKSLPDCGAIRFTSGPAITAADHVAYCERGRVLVEMAAGAPASVFVSLERCLGSGASVAFTAHWPSVPRLHVVLTFAAVTDRSRSADVAWAEYTKHLAAAFGSDLRVAEEFRTSAVRQLADAIDRDEAWDVLPILADALQDAGLSGGPVLDYLRGPGPFFRGCRVLESCRGVW